MNGDNCCANCEYWNEKYMKCEHPEQRADDADYYMAPPDKMCDLYLASCGEYEKWDG